MLNTLLESRSYQRRSKGTVLASVAFHTAIVIGGVYATASGVAAHDAPEPPVTVHWVTPSPVNPLAPSHPTPKSARANHVPSAPPLHVPLNVDVTLPYPDANPPVVAPSDFRSSSVSASGGREGPGIPAGGNTGAPAYDVSQVDSPVSMLGTFRPDYPAQLRAAGVQGEVIVQFVVNESGRVDPRSIRILSSSNDLFASSVRSALGRMRFVPARLGDSAVAQLVQQTFVFRLDR
jgi:protein TonB